MFCTRAVNDLDLAPRKQRNFKTPKQGRFPNRRAWDSVPTREGDKKCETSKSRDRSPGYDSRLRRLPRIWLDRKTYSFDFSILSQSLERSTNNLEWELIFQFSNFATPLPERIQGSVTVMPRAGIDPIRHLEFALEDRSPLIEGWQARLRRNQDEHLLTGAIG